MKGKSALFWLGLAAAAGGVLFQTSYEVQELEDKLGSLNRQIMDEQEAIQILKAEWSYLNDPTRLESLATQHLQLQPTEARQFVALDVVPMRPATAPDAAPNKDGVAPLPPMVRLSPATPAAPVTAVAATGTGNASTINGTINGTINKGGIIPASLTPGMATPAKPAPIKPSAIVPGAAKAPALPAAKAAPAPVHTARPVDVAARPMPSLPTQTAAVPASTVKTLSVPTARQPQSGPPQPAALPANSPAAPAKATDSIGVLVARLGANR